ncbi:MAG: redoxin [Bacteroidetes bacterium]|nr:redoxin [Bacteroidota bacterium]
MKTSRYIRLVSLLAMIGLLSFKPVNTAYQVGDNVADFSLKSTDGRMVSLSSYKNAKGFIVVFTCNHCPFAKKYQERMNALNKKYTEKGFPLLAISSNDAIAVPSDSYENMQARAKEEHYNFPYLFDETQSVAKTFGAAKTPQAFVLAKENGKLVLKYSGAIDDNGAEPAKVTRHYAEDAVNALLTGKKIDVTETRSIGCPIKWKNS